MKNSIILKNEQGEDISVEVLLAFSIEKYNKNYIAYTLNDDNISPSVAVFISEVDLVNKKMISIPENQMKSVLDVYNQLKQEINEM